MNILVTNDDGIDSKGLHALAKALSTAGNVVIAAPLKEHSGVGASISAWRAISCRKVDGGFLGYVIDGTPVDCVRVALGGGILAERPDYVFTGINPGLNVSPHIYHSGTVSAATEAAMAGVTAVAVSLQTDDVNEPDFTAASEIALRWLRVMDSEKLPAGALYNLNIPMLPLDEIKGIRAAKLSESVSRIEFRKEKGPLGGDLFWMGESHEDDPPKESDLYLVRAGYAAVTPLLADRLDRERYKPRMMYE